MNTTPIRSSRWLMAVLLLLLVTAPAEAQLATFLHDFSSPDITLALAKGTLIVANGNIYGVTVMGGNHGLGTLYRVDPSGRYTVLHHFGAPGDGAGPTGALVMDPIGILYGTTDGGYENTGVVFRLDLAGDYRVLHTFTTAEGWPGTFLRDASGNLFGTADGGEVSSRGTILYKLTADGVFSIVQTFQERGVSVELADGSGNLYGWRPAGRLQHSQSVQTGSLRQPRRPAHTPSH